MPKYVGGYEYAGGHRPPRTGAVIAEGLGKVLTKGIQEYQDQRILNAIKENPNASPIDLIHLLGSLSAEKQKTVFTAYALSQKQQKAEERSAEQIRRYDEQQEYKNSREKRLSSKDMQAAYQNRLKQINNDLKDPYTNREETKLLKQQREALTKELGQNISRVRKGQSPIFEHLEIEEDPTPAQSLPIEGMNQMSSMRGQPTTPSEAPQMQQSIQATQPTRQKWNPQNPQHQARALQILEQTKGDRALANQALAQEFDR